MGYAEIRSRVFPGTRKECSTRHPAQFEIRLPGAFNFRRQVASGGHPLQFAADRRSAQPYRTFR